MEHSDLIKNSKRIVFKFGTNVLTNDRGDLALSRIYSFIEDIAELKKQDKEIIIITSGAVGFGAKKLKLATSPETIAEKQACAAIGQAGLMAMYEEGFEKFDILSAQVLLTEDDFSCRYKYLNLRTTLNTLLSFNVIPIINQNDTVCSSEIESYLGENVQVSFSDNDKLASLVVSKLDADLLVIFSDIDGLYDSDPRENNNAKIIPVVKEVDENIEKLGFKASSRGRGGMKTKLEAAKIVTHSGGVTMIVNGKKPNIINKVFNGAESGTIFLPSEKLSGKKRWIAYATNITGYIKVNDGAEKALRKKFASLLPAGITEIINTFEKGDVISIINSKDEEFARGIVNYDAEDCDRLKGKQSEDIQKILGYKTYDEIITRDNIAIL